MSDIKRYYYLKLKSNFLNSKGINILENLPICGQVGSGKTHLSITLALNFIKLEKDKKEKKATLKKKQKNFVVIFACHGRMDYKN